ncbi:hypothetical protein HOU00_gp232 [Caulobacter phage CcrPW]|uniref:Uncharacterized protein n=1 Tax=Caulobacter phage CcrPW TaxID=2283271 RepID=A0A385EAS4_9CAUD|nr:hypothetical protein HOU00_gp232 [Caulobacter phage CcrPW]AXQ68893.1 hypothetical protein CcrPW_gp354 [Caulobacter phage CcrPW]
MIGDAQTRALNIALLERAASLIEEKGWWFKGITDGRGKLCIVDALRKAVNLGVQERSFTTTADRDAFIERKPQALALFLIIHLGLHPYPSPTTSLIEWNDAPDRTLQEVLDALRNTAKEMP